MLSLCGERKMRQNASLYTIILTWRKTTNLELNYILKKARLSVLKKEILSSSAVSPLWGCDVFENGNGKNDQKYELPLPFKQHIVSVCDFSLDS